MRTLLVVLGIALTMVTCKRGRVEKPVWVNPQAVLAVPGAPLQFQASAAEWRACLYSFTQPISLEVQSRPSGFTVSLTDAGGVLEGPAQLCLTAGEQSFFYPVELRNSQKAIVAPKDYRSPKTVNPDSSLLQQRIRLAVDQHRNLVKLDNSDGYFAENEISLSPKVATYRAIPNQGLTAYYVQPGTVTHIPIQAAYRRDLRSYAVTVGPLTDRYKNQVADGTLVNFLYEDWGETYQTEAKLLNGYATVLIPTHNQNTYRLRAVMQHTVSQTITLRQ